MTNEKNNRIKILLSGEGGQGMQTIAKILAQLAYQKKYIVTLMPHYGVEMRMGISLAYIQISTADINYPKFDTADIVIAMTTRELSNVKKFVGNNTRVINAVHLDDLLRERNLPVMTLNMLVLGIIIKELKSTFNIGFEKEEILNIINKILEKKPDLTKNRVSFELGCSLDQKDYNISLDKVRATHFESINDKDKNKEHIKYPDLCKGCGLCLIKCPMNALSFNIDKKNYLNKPLPKVDLDKCTGCGICESICPDCAIKVNKKK